MHPNRDSRPQLIDFNRRKQKIVLESTLVLPPGLLKHWEILCFPLSVSETQVNKQLLLITINSQMGKLETVANIRYDGTCSSAVRRYRA